MKNRGSAIQEFGRLIFDNAKSAVEVQTHWVVAKEIDWEAKTMTATGVVDDLDFFSVLLGLGANFRRPAIGSKCLIGIVNNNPAATFLMECEQIEEFEITDNTGFKLLLKDGVLTLNGDGFGGIVNAIELKEQIDKNTAAIQAIQQAFESWTVVPNDGGGALKALASGFVNLELADLSDIENEKIKHG